MYKVFFNDRILFLTDQPESELILAANTVHKYSTVNQLRRFVANFEKHEDFCVGLVYGHDITLIWDSFTQFFQVITAAGGVVVNARQEILGIHRLGKNDLPKGKTESGESIEESAIREVQEECGIRRVEVTHKITSTFHTYRLKDNLILKETHWFYMRALQEDPLSPQTDEGITEVFWFSPGEIDTFLENTYPSIKDVFVKSGLISST